MKNLSRSILAFALAAALLAAGIFVPMAGNAHGESQEVAFFLPPLIEGS